MEKKENEERRRKREKNKMIQRKWENWEERLQERWVVMMAGVRTKREGNEKGERGR